MGYSLPMRAVDLALREWTNLTWLERIYPGIAAKKIQENLKRNERKSMRKQSWLDRLNDYGVVHWEMSPSGNVSHHRHGYVPMSNDVVWEGVRDWNLMAYMSGLPEFKQWNKSTPCNKLFTTEKSTAYYSRVDSASVIQARETTKRIFPNGHRAK